MKNISLILLLSFLASCMTHTVSESGLYWGDYSKTLYAYKKTPTPENLAVHKNELLTILSKSKELNLRPPPGIQAELGVILMNEKDEKSAKEYFIGEGNVYPESKVLVAKLMEASAEKKEKK